MKRSPRDGWRLVELVDGRWQTTKTGDREELRVLFTQRTRDIYNTPCPPDTRYSLRTAGRAVSLHDANGLRRDTCPAMPRHANGARLEWPDAPPGPDGADVVPWAPRGAVV